MAREDDKKPAGVAEPNVGTEAGSTQDAPEVGEAEPNVRTEAGYTQDAPPPGEESQTSALKRGPRRTRPLRAKPGPTRRPE